MENCAAILNLIWKAWCFRVINWDSRIKMKQNLQAIVSILHISKHNFHIEHFQQEQFQQNTQALPLVGVRNFHLLDQKHHYDEKIMIFKHKKGKVLDRWIDSDLSTHIITQPQ